MMFRSRWSATAAEDYAGGAATPTEGGAAGGSSTAAATADPRSTLEACHGMCHLLF